MLKPGPAFLQVDLFLFPAAHRESERSNVKAVNAVLSIGKVVYADLPLECFVHRGHKLHCHTHTVSLLTPHPPLHQLNNILGFFSQTLVSTSCFWSQILFTLVVPLLFFSLPLYFPFVSFALFILNISVMHFRSSLAIIHLFFSLIFDLFI